VGKNDERGTASCLVIGTSSTMYVNLLERPYTSIPTSTITRS